MKALKVPGIPYWALGKNKLPGVMDVTFSLGLGEESRSRAKSAAEDLRTVCVKQPRAVRNQQVWECRGQKRTRARSLENGPQSAKQLPVSETEGLTPDDKVPAPLRGLCLCSSGHPTILLGPELTINQNKF